MHFIAQMNYNNLSVGIKVLAVTSLIRFLRENAQLKLVNIFAIMMGVLHNHLILSTYV